MLGQQIPAKDDKLERLRRSECIRRLQQTSQAARETQRALTDAVMSAYDMGLAGSVIGPAIGMTEGGARMIRKRALQRGTKCGSCGGWAYTAEEAREHARRRDGSRDCDVRSVNAG